MEVIPGSAVYGEFLREVKTQILRSRLTAARSINRALIGLYWSIGHLIVGRQETLGWGQAVVEQLSTDLRAEFPGMTGFSPRNLWDIKRFYETYAAAPEKLRQAVAEIPWGHNVLIMQRIKKGPAHGEMDRISQALTQRVKELAERYEMPLPQVTNRVVELEAKVDAHLARMGFAWK